MNRELTNIALIGVGGFILYKLLKDQLNKATAPLSDAIAKFWVSLTEQPAMVVQGNVKLPDGTAFPLSTAVVRADAQGHVYTQAAGHVYQLQPHDADGDWPAVLVQ
jgi:hypothetical protein